jgi:hypothetical protein
MPLSVIDQTASAPSRTGIAARQAGTAQPSSATICGMPEGDPGRNWVAELGEEPLKTGGRDGAQQSRRRVRSVAEGVGCVGRDVR